MRTLLPAERASRTAIEARADGRRDLLAFRREPGFECWVNLGAGPVALPAGEVLAASTDITGGTVPTDAAVWLQVS